MLVPIDQKRRTLAQGSRAAAGAETTFTRAPPGAGGFRFDQPTVGFVLSPQRRHEGRYGGDSVRRMPLDSGMGWVLPAGVDGWCSWDEDTAFLNVSLAPELFSRVDTDAGALRIGAQVYDPMLVQMAITLHEQAESSGPVSALYRETLALGLTAHLVQSFGAPRPVEPAVAGAGDPRLRRVIDHIEAHLTDDLSIDALAGLAALSPFHFARSFKRATGMPPHKFVASRRIERARALLKTTTLPVAEIAFRVGWENVSHFTQAFRALTGVTPAVFRAVAT